MVAPAKLTEEQWGVIRSAWENDPREGYTWLIKDFGLHVSAPAIRKRALKEVWLKVSSELRSAVKRPKNQGSEKLATNTKVSGSVVSTKTNKKSAKNMVSNKETLNEKPSDESTMDQEHVNQVFSYLHQPIKIGSTKTPNSVASVDDATTETAKKAARHLMDAQTALASLTEKQRLFVQNYLTHYNGMRAYKEAGYKGLKNGEIAAASAKLKRHPNVDNAIRLLEIARVSSLQLDGDILVRELFELYNARPEDIAHYRRRCCRYCWGVDNHYQCTPAEYRSKLSSHEIRRAKTKEEVGVDIGEFESFAEDWYNANLDPNQDCPECHGNGVGEVFIEDTRKLNPAAKRLFKGVKETKFGIEVSLIDIEKARDDLFKVLGLYREKDSNININIIDAGNLAKQYEERMQAARERQQKVIDSRAKELGIDDV